MAQKINPIDTDTVDPSVLGNLDDVNVSNNNVIAFSGSAQKLKALGHIVSTDGTGALTFDLTPTAELSIQSIGAILGQPLKSVTINSGLISIHDPINGPLSSFQTSHIGKIEAKNETTLIVATGTLNVTDSSTIGNLILLSNATVNFKNATINEKNVTINGLVLNRFSELSFENFVNAKIETTLRSTNNEAETERLSSQGSTINLGVGCHLTLGTDNIEYFDNEVEVINRLDGQIVDDFNGSSVTKVGKNTWSLGGTNRYHGGTSIEGGTLEARSRVALGNGMVNLAEGTTLRIGDKYNKLENLLEVVDWNSNNGDLELVVGTATNKISSLVILNSANGTTNIKIVGSTQDINKWGARVPFVGTDGYAVLAEANNADAALGGILNEYNENAFKLVSSDNVDVHNDLHEKGEAVTFTGFETSRYGYKFEPRSIEDQTGRYDTWGISSKPQDVTVPDLSTQVLMNIIAFEIPRAQNVDGPWAKVKGGEMNDNKAFFDHNSYQTVQVGWDKTLATVDGGAWNGGIFFEGDWAYGRGNWSSMWGTINGRLKSEESGIGAGLYLSKSFKNGVYFDTIGRINVFENEVNMIQTDGVIDSANNYNGKWSSSFFNLAFELGKDFTSKDGTWTFNPYERVIYTAAPQRTFNVVFGDDSIVNVRNNTVDAWTNKLGARLAYHNKQHRKTSSIVFVGADYYRGLSGRLTTETLDRLNVTEVKNNTWHQITSRRSRNDLNYGTATLGYTVLPKDNIAITAQGDVLYGEVDGWSVGLSGRVSF